MYKYLTLPITRVDDRITNLFNCFFGDKKNVNSCHFFRYPIFNFELLKVRISNWRMNYIYALVTQSKALGSAFDVAHYILILDTGHN